MPMIVTVSSKHQNDPVDQRDPEHREVMLHPLVVGIADRWLPSHPDLGHRIDDRREHRQIDDGAHQRHDARGEQIEGEISGVLLNGDLLDDLDQPDRDHQHRADLGEEEEMAPEDAKRLVDQIRNAQRSKRSFALLHATPPLLRLSRRRVRRTHQHRTPTPHVCSE
jgi:hypothetical protein